MAMDVVRDWVRAEFDVELREAGGEERRQIQEGREAMRMMLLTYRTWSSQPQNGHA